MIIARLANERLTRRAFLRLLASAGTGAAVYGALNLLSREHATPAGWLLIGHRLGAGAAARHFLFAAELGGSRVRTIPVASFPHGIACDPARPSRVFLMPQFGELACEVDLEQSRMLRLLRASEGRQFYGHGTYSADGATLYTVEARADFSNGVVHARDTTDLRVLERLDSHGIGPHDCRLVDGGKTLLVVNSGFIQTPEKRYANHHVGAGPGRQAVSSVAAIDLASGRLLELIARAEPSLNAGHLDVAEGGALAVAFKPTVPGGSGAVMMRTGPGRLERFEGSERIYARMQGQALSLRIHAPSGNLGVTSPDAGLVSFWNLGSRSFVKEHHLPRPQGINLTLDERLFVVNSGDTGREPVFIDASTLERVRAYPQLRSLGNGPHITVWDPRI